MQYAEANPRIRPYISIRLKALLQRVRNRLKDVLIYLHSPKWLTQKRGYIYATAAAGVGGWFEPEPGHAAGHAPCHAAACHAMPSVLVGDAMPMHTLLLRCHATHQRSCLCLT